MASNKKCTQNKKLKNAKIKTKVVGYCHEPEQ